MASYTFEDAKTGECVVLEMSMHEAVPFGESIRRGNRKLVRVPDAGRTVIVKGSIGHIARSLPWHKNEDGSPAIKGADGYTEEGFPIVESQATVDRIRRMNPERHLDRGDKVLDNMLTDGCGL